LFDNTNYTPDSAKAQAILKAYKNTDAITGKILDMIDDETAVLFCTALQFNIPASVKYKPVMAAQFHLECASDEEAKAVSDNLYSYEMDSDEYFHEGSRTVFLAYTDGPVVDVMCRVTKDARKDATFIDNRNGKKYSLYDSVYQMSDTKTGTHNPIGMYWFRQPQQSPKIVEETCPPSQVHHDVIDFFGAAKA